MTRQVIPQTKKQGSGHVVNISAVGVADAGCEQGVGFGVHGE